jgi:predicted CoA-substrate-specific enzyme activase
MTSGNPVRAVKNVIKNMRNDIDLNKYQVVSVGTTGSARKLIGTMLGASTIKNEITAHAVGTVKLYPDVRTIFEIGGQDSKITLVNNGVVCDYAMNTLCAAGTGAFISSLAKRLDVPIEEVSNVAFSSRNKVNIAARCTVFAESDLIHKIQAGYKKEDIIAGVCRAVAVNYVNNVCKGKRIKGPIVFNGGVSKNKAVVRAFEELVESKIIVDKNSHLMGAFGIAIMARESKKESVFNFSVDDLKLETKINQCGRCSNNCEIVMVYRNDELLDFWGNHCEKGSILKNV